MGKVAVVNAPNCGVETILTPLDKAGRAVYACMDIDGMEKLDVWYACPVKVGAVVMLGIPITGPVDVDGIVKLCA